MNKVRVEDKVSWEPCECVLDADDIIDVMIGCNISTDRAATIAKNSAWLTNKIITRVIKGEK